MRGPGLSIDSVTGVEVCWPVAGPGARTYAFLIDWLMRASVAVGWYVGAALIHNGRLSLAAPLNPSPTWFAFVLAPAAAIYFLCPWVLEIVLHGRTPGMRMARVRVISRDGTPPSISSLLTRNVFRLVDSLPLFYGVGLIATMCTEDHVRVGDMAAGTLMVYDGRDALPQASDGAGLERRAQAWQSAAVRARRLAGGRGTDLRDAMQLGEDYRLLAHDLARARRLIPDSSAREYLEAAYAQAHAALHHGAWHLRHTLLGWLRDELPAVTSRLAPHIAWAAAIFILTIAAGYQAVRKYPDLIGLFASPELIATVERGQLWTQGLLNVVPSSVLSLQILTNNIVVSLSAYCAGFLFGLGTLYILGLNGLMLGAVIAFTRLHGLDVALARFMVAHGCVELSVMCLSGAAGAAVGEALIRPAHSSRMESFRLAARDSGKLLAACVLLLAGCGIIEGYISADPRVPFWARLLIGVGYFAFMLALLGGWPLRALGTRQAVRAT
jgi:uncharacterized membrane protein SpoIIM required for sporulation/uncharacterized RDD family membrane protein YckC